MGRERLQERLEFDRQFTKLHHRFVDLTLEVHHRLKIAQDMGALLHRLKPNVQSEVLLFAGGGFALTWHGKWDTIPRCVYETASFVVCMDDTGRLYTKKNRIGESFENADQELRHRLGPRA
jgi:effector-binding domain-containing protein